MYCLRDNLSKLFDSISTKYDAQMLVNSTNDKAEEAIGSLILNTLMISNNSHWKGIFPRDTDIRNTLTLYFGGFWKRFKKECMVPLLEPLIHLKSPVFARNKASEKNLKDLAK